MTTPVPRRISTLARSQSPDNETPVFKVTEDGNGGFHLKGHFNATGIGIGQTSGATYNWNDAINEEDNFRAPRETFTSQRSPELIGRGHAANYRLHFLFHVTVTPDGVANINADKTRSARPPSGAAM